jgi:hypothetical protein
MDLQIHPSGVLRKAISSSAIWLFVERKMAYRESRYGFL